MTAWSEKSREEYQSYCNCLIPEEKVAKTSKQQEEKIYTKITTRLNPDFLPITRDTEFVKPYATAVPYLLKANI